MSISISELSCLYSEHIAELQQRTQTILVREGLDALVIHSGQALNAFLDDYHYPFQVNPHFKHWLPTDTEHCWLIVTGTQKPMLIFYQPDDFWHQSIELKDQFWLPFFNIQVITQREQVTKYLSKSKNNIAYIGADIEIAQSLNFEKINPTAVIDYYHFHRAYKTPYEQACIRQANIIAIKGHNAAREMFLAKQSEFAIQQAYLQAILHNESQTPYQNIIALNEHAAILHYGQFATQKPDKHHSFLIDAGAKYNGYCADISRTYSAENDAFADIIKALNSLMLSVVERLTVGTHYIDLHQQAYQEIGQLLFNLGIIKGDVEAAIDTGIISTFFPHGLGHHLGLQTHDVGGFMANDRGQLLERSKKHPFLRTTRMIEANQVFTIEPGLYFIDSLIKQLKASVYKDMINWQVVEQFRPYGGIRIEDNIIVHQSCYENITRQNGLN